MGFKSKVTSKNKLHLLIKRIEKLDGMSAEAGYEDKDKYEDDLGMATLVGFHEQDDTVAIGPVKGLPRRPLMTKAYEPMIMERDAFRECIWKIVSFTSTVDGALKDVAEHIRKEIRKSIARGEFIPLKSETIAKKGHSMHFIETGKMLKLIRARVNSKGKK